MGPNQVCTLFGAQPGSDVVIGSNYLEAGYGITVADIWRRNLVVIIAFLIFFLFTQVIAIEYLSVRPFYAFELNSTQIATICSPKCLAVHSVFMPRKIKKRKRSTKFNVRRRPNATGSLMTRSRRGSRMLGTSASPWCRGAVALCTNPPVVGSAPKLTGGHLRGRILTIMFLCLAGR